MSSKRLDGHLSKLGYCTRGECRTFMKIHEVKVGGVRIFDPSLKATHDHITVDSEPLDAQTLTLLMNKPMGVVCSHDDSGKLIYSLLPPRWQKRNPKISTIGRLDRDTTGAILLSDDGGLNHTLTSPKNDIAKVYEVTLAHPLRGDEADVFASGGLLLHGEKKPLLPAIMIQTSPTQCTLEIVEGKYHQVKRMFGAVGNRVIALHRQSFNGYDVVGLELGGYKVIN